MEKENSNKKISVIPWIDLSRALQSRILQDMSDSFGKPVMTPLRFFRPSCLVWFYREGSLPDYNGIAITLPDYNGIAITLPDYDGIAITSPDYDGIAITFRIGDAYYLDKFFVTKKGKGIGQRFLYNWIESLDSRPVRLVRWRTDDTLAQKFYGKHPAVWTIAHHEEYVYQGIRRTALDTEEVLSWLRLPSAFSSLPDSSVYQQGLNRLTPLDNRKP